MAVVEMRKLTVIGLNSSRFSFIRELMHRGVVEINSQENGVGTYTTFLARINQDASERLENGGRRLPIGRWVPLEGPDPDGVLDRSYSLDIKDHYADMLGDFGLVMTEGEFHARHPGFDILQSVSIITMLVLWLVFSIVFKKKGWF